MSRAQIDRNFGTREVRITSSEDGDFKVVSNNVFVRAWDKVYNFIFKRMTVVFRIMMWYLTFSLVGGALLWWPATHVDGAEAISFIDALFMSSSAFSDTGLTTVTIVEQFNIWGQIILFFEILVGGLGWFTIKVFLLSFIIRKGMSWRNKRHLAAESGADMKTAVGIAKTAGVVTLASIAIFGTAFGIMFHYQAPIEGLVNPTTYNPTENWGQAMWTGYFMAGSAINNAGMDIIGGSSLMAYYNNYALQFMIMFLFVLGGMGFGIIYDFNHYLRARWKGERFRFSLLTKVSMITYLSVSVIGLGLSYSFEWIAYLQNAESSFLGMDSISPYGDLGTTTDRLVAIAFNTMSTRNAGFATIDLNALSTATINTYSIMMFIGSGPGSTAGGIRTTTLFVVIIAIWQYIRGKKETTAFDRRIPSQTVRKAFILSISAITLVMTSAIIIQVLEVGNSTHTYWFYNPGVVSTPENPTNWVPVEAAVSFQDSMFVVFSAFGTTGLSTVDIAALTIGSKIILIIVMFIGQLGILSALKVFSGRDNVSKNSKVGKMITEDIPIG